MNEKVTITDQQLRAWFEERPALSYSVIEEEAGLPAYTLHRWKQGRNLPNKHLPTLLKVLVKYGWKA